MVSGPRLEILDIVVRYPGSTHDSRIYNRSAVRTRFHSNEIPGLLLGDNGYACSHKLLTPFLTPQNIHEIMYNASHKSTRNIVERLFGIWKRRFYCLKGILRTKLSTSIIIICATAVLHNIGLQHDIYISDEEEQEGDENDANPLPNNIVPGGLAFRHAFALANF